MFVGACWHHIYGGKRHDDRPTWYFLGKMQNLFTYELTRSAIFCQHATLALLWATVFPLAVICILNFSYEFIMMHCSSWVKYTALARIILHKGESNDAINAPFMWTRIEPKYNKSYQIKWIGSLYKSSLRPSIKMLLTWLTLNQPQQGHEQY